MTVEQNSDYNGLFIEIVFDKFIPHPQDDKEVICLPQGMQFHWTHCTHEKSGCSSCGGMIKTTYYVNRIVNECDGIPLPVSLVLDSLPMTITRDKRLPPVCTLFYEDRRGLNIDTLTPPHLRPGYKW